MKLSPSLAKKLLRLMQGESFPHSQLKYTEIERMVEEGVLSLRSSGTRTTVYCRDITMTQRYLVNQFGIADLGQFIDALGENNLQRSDVIRVAANSKMKTIRSFKGFLVNCVQPLDTKLGGVPFQVSPCPGTFTYIYDFENFVPAIDITIIGVENGENFRYIERQQGLFSFTRILFVSRYPQSGDLIKWLQTLPNRYVHFGDFDFSGINIYLSEFKQQLGSRAEFFVPAGIEKLFRAYGNRDLYQRQLSCAAKRDNLPEPALKLLWDIICTEKKGLEQEVLIASVET
ncbi:MAG: hypothetical protein J7K90_02240 [Desulfuromusa sp.]|nr:hypothetical protein [Desulfuromusa sp.]